MDPLRFGRNAHNLLERIARALEKIASELERLNDNLENDD